MNDMIITLYWVYINNVSLSLRSNKKQTNKPRSKEAKTHKPNVAL